jgi:hypothetical protein
MPRNSSGTYSLPSGNPVSSGALIEASWANTTLSDLGSAMTDSLSRNGEGGMTAAFRAFSGTISAPGISFTAETASGWYRAGSGDIRFSLGGVDLLKATSTNFAVTGAMSASSGFTGNLTGDVTGNVSGTASGLSATLAVNKGGTGQTSYTDGQLLIGNSTGNTLTKSTLTAGTGVTITNGNGSITIAATGSGGTVTSVGLSMPSGFSVGSSPVTSSGTIAVTTTLSGVLKGTGSGFSAATAGTDYLAPPSGTALLKANSGGALANAVAGTDYVTPTGTETLTNKTLTNPTVTNYTETAVTANTGTTYTIDITNGTVQILTLTGNCTFTFPTATAGKSFTLLLKQDATGSRTVTWPAAVKWPSSTAPTITATASKMDKYVFVADGTNWVGSNAGQNYL